MDLKRFRPAVLGIAGVIAGGLAIRKLVLPFLRSLSGTPLSGDGRSEKQETGK